MNKAKHVARKAIGNDIKSWMELIHLVKDNFPGLETPDEIKSYEDTVLKNIRRGTALCVKNNDLVIGVLLFSINSNMLCFLAVHPGYRREGVGSTLVAKFLEVFPKNQNIKLSTFREEDPWGQVSRPLYEKFGFIAGALTTEFGYPHQEFYLRREKTDSNNCQNQT